MKDMCKQMIWLALICLSGTAAADQTPAEFLQQARKRHIEQRSLGLNGFDATFTAQFLPGVDEPVSLNYRWSRPGKQTWDLERVPKAWKKLLKDSFNDCWREISGILLLDLIESAEKLVMTVKDKKTLLLGTLPWATFAATFHPTQHYLEQIAFPRVGLTIGYEYVRLGKRVRLRRRKVQFKQHKLNLVYSHFKLISSFLLPTRVRLLDKHEFEIRYKTINGQASIPGVRLESEILERVKSFRRDWRSWTQRERMDQIEALAELDHDAASAAIAGSGLRSPALALRRAAAIQLGRMERKNVVPQLCTALGKNAKHKTLYPLIARSLGQIADPGAIKTLSLGWNHHKAAGWAGFALRIHALGNIRDKRSIDALLRYFVKMHRDYVKHYQHVIVEALKKLTDKDFGKDTQAWRRWWRKNRETFAFN